VVVGGEFGADRRHGRFVGGGVDVDGFEYADLVAFGSMTLRLRHSRISAEWIMACLLSR
jgi:hypothetical protein